MHKCPNAQMFKCSNARMFKYSNAQMLRWKTLACLPPISWRPKSCCHCSTRFTASFFANVTKPNPLRHPVRNQIFTQHKVSWALTVNIGIHFQRRIDFWICLCLWPLHWLIAFCAFVHLTICAFVHLCIFIVLEFTSLACSTHIHGLRNTHTGVSWWSARQRSTHPRRSSRKTGDGRSTVSAPHPSQTLATHQRIF